jgi:MSHA biogenesis protein MshO
MKSRGFTLIELVVAITISSIVVIFATMFIGAPVGAYETQSRRAVLVADTSGAWPRMETDLRAALPNSLRTRRNGSYVVLEMLAVIDEARYMTSASAATITTAGAYRGASAPAYLSVNNLGTGGSDAYGLSGSMTPAGTTITVAAGALPGESVVSVSPAPVFGPDSPKRRLYFVSGPVTYLCDEGAGTLTRYANYSVAANQAARDTPGELTGAGAAGQLVTQGLTTCNFTVSAVSPTQSQTVTARLTTTRNGDVVALMHSAHAEYVP